MPLSTFVMMGVVGGAIAHAAYRQHRGLSTDECDGLQGAEGRRLRFEVARGQLDGLLERIAGLPAGAGDDRSFLVDLYGKHCSLACASTGKPET